MINYITLNIIILYPSIDAVLAYLIVGSMVSAYLMLSDFDDDCEPWYNLALYYLLAIVWLPGLAYFRAKRMISNVN